MEDKSIKQIFDEACDRVTVNRRLIQQVKDIRAGFVNRNEEHLNFFSSNLIGVYPVRYRDVDRQRWCEEILEVNESDIKHQLKYVKALDPNWVRANDVINLSFVWLAHQIQKAPGLTPRERTMGLENTILMMQYKFITSLMAHFFPYPADPAIAQATYEALNRKFEIKQQGSWQAYFDYRTRLILHPNSIHYRTIDKMGSDDDVISMVSDIQKRLREVVKNYKSVFESVRNQKLRISSTKTIIELDGQKEILDQSRDHTDYVRYLKDIITDKPTFIRQELVAVIQDAMHTMNPDHLTQSLIYCSDNYGRGGDKNIESLIDNILSYVYRYLEENEGILSGPNDLATLLSKLKNLFTASRMSDPQLILMRELADKIVDRSVRSRNSAALASVRTGLQLYLCLRAFSRNYFS